jgi:hypothetical protein
VQINFFDNKAENADIKKEVEALIRRDAGTLYGFVTLDDSVVTKIVRDDFDVVNKVKVSRKYNLNVVVNVTKNEEYFSTCMRDEENFLIPCMVGNTDGEYYKAVATTTPEDVNIGVSPEVLYDADTQEPLDFPDSLSGSRIYTSDDFRKLVEFLKWVKKNGFEVKKVFVDDLKIVSIYTDYYMIKISLDKGFAPTVKDFELISRTGVLQKYISDDKEEIKYIDLSYKDKVFFMLKNGKDGSTFEINASSTATSTATSTR